MCLRARSPSASTTPAHCCQVQLPARPSSVPAECHWHFDGSQLWWDVWRAWTLSATAYACPSDSSCAACTTHPDTTGATRSHRAVRPQGAAEGVLSWWYPVPAVWEACLPVPSLASW